MKKCPQCDSEALFIHYENFGRREVQVEPAHCEVCGWTERKDWSEVLQCTPLTNHEIKYIKHRA